MAKLDLLWFTKETNRAFKGYHPNFSLHKGLPYVIKREFEQLKDILHTLVYTKDLGITNETNRA